MPGSTVLLIGGSMAALVVISVFTFLCSNRRQVQRASTSSSQRSGVDDVELGHRCATASGIDEAVLAAYPTKVYSSASRRDEDQMAGGVPDDGVLLGGQQPDDTCTTCAVCLAEYADGDELRLLPGCRHAFHRSCVDEWLRRRPSCPLCRTTPLTTSAPPVATSPERPNRDGIR